MLAWVRAFLGTIIKGLVIIVLVVIAFNFLALGWGYLSEWWKTLYDLSYLRFLDGFGIKWVVVTIAIVAGLWFVGHLKIGKLISFLLFGKQKGLFCVRFKLEYTSRPWNYLVGAVTNMWEEDGKTYYNICCPNIAGIHVYFKVRAEETERVNVEPEELMTAVPFLGFVRLKNL